MHLQKYKCQTNVACVDASSTKGFSSSPHLADRKKSAIAKKLSNETSASRLAALPVTTNKTIFFLPGVDIKVCLLLLVFVIVMNDGNVMYSMFLCF